MCMCRGFWYLKHCECSNILSQHGTELQMLFFRDWCADNVSSFSKMKLLYRLCVAPLTALQDYDNCKTLEWPQLQAPALMGFVGLSHSSFPLQRGAWNAAADVLHSSFYCSVLGLSITRLHAISLLLSSRILPWTFTLKFSHPHVTLVLLCEGSDCWETLFRHLENLTWIIVLLKNAGVENNPLDWRSKNFLPIKRNFLFLSSDEEGVISFTSLI